MAAICPRVCRPKRCRASLVPADTGSRSTGWGARKAAGIGGHPGRAQGRAGPGGHQGREFSLADADAGIEPPGQGVQQGGDQPGLAAVHLLQPVDGDR